MKKDRFELYLDAEHWKMLDDICKKYDISRSQFIEILAYREAKYLPQMPKKTRRGNAKTDLKHRSITVGKRVIDLVTNATAAAGIRHRNRSAWITSMIDKAVKKIDDTDSLIAEKETDNMNPYTLVNIAMLTDMFNKLESLCMDNRCSLSCQLEKMIDQEYQKTRPKKKNKTDKTSRDNAPRQMSFYDIPGFR